ncbi:MAG: NUDIX domain-containing protein [Candidatus Wildermuthbacteria bacterium]|nr:NUDIX domain-containing protein [Candidatus Wildermuthbacteria bacterium]
MQKYTLGFIFTQDLSRVLLVEKNRPEWQKGKLNAVGGKIETGEASIACVVREIFEETGLKTTETDWIFFGELRGKTWQVDAYVLLHQGDPKDAVTKTDEKIQWFSVKDIPEHALDNIPWLIHLALDKIRHNEFKNFFIQYHA